MKKIIDKIQIPRTSGKIAILSDLTTINKGEVDENQIYSYYFEFCDLLEEGKNYRIQITQLD